MMNSDTECEQGDMKQEEDPLSVSDITTESHGKHVSNFLVIEKKNASPNSITSNLR